MLKRHPWIGDARGIGAGGNLKTLHQHLVYGITGLIELGNVAMAAFASLLVVGAVTAMVAGIVEIIHTFQITA